MSSQNLVPFHITSVDSLGQGVSKITDKVTFVPKTLPGEEGSALILAEKAKISFAKLSQLDKASARRIRPACSHFEQCSGCHYLHTDYPFELELKLQNMKNLFRHYPDLDHQVIAASERLAYRNRMQLHYDLDSQQLGLLDARSFQILEIPHCLIAQPQVSKVMSELYHQKNWLKLAPAGVKRGHVEIYFHQNQVKLNWNKSYASGGFTQVHAEMNLKLKQKILEFTTALKPRFILDLFAGDGNLSNNLPHQGRLCVDMYQKSMPQDFYSQNLYGKNALSSVAHKIKGQQVDLLILDPPRSGLKNLAQWLEMSQARQVIYVSCDPHTQVRDISSLSNYQINHSILLDLFPATFHFETMLILERKN